MDEFRKDNDLEAGYFPEGTEHLDAFKTMGSRDFVWDEAKNRHNLKIHHVDFETAMFVFNDEDRIEIYDETHSVVYTDKIILGREMIRLISARRASKFEEMVYLHGGEGR